MKYIKVSVIAATLIAAGFSSAYAAVTPPAINSSSITISGSITSSTCVVTFPTSATIPDIYQNDYTNTPADAQVGTDVNVGNVTFTGCNGKQVTLAAKANALEGDNTKGTFAFAGSGTENPMVYTLGYQSGGNTGDFNLGDATPVSFTANGDDFNLPQTLKVMKKGETIPDIASYAGAFTATVTYTATYQ